MGIEGTMLMGAITAYAGAVYAGTAAGAIPAKGTACWGLLCTGTIFALIDRGVVPARIRLSRGRRSISWRLGASRPRCGGCCRNYIAAGHPVPAAHLSGRWRFPYLSQIPWVGGCPFCTVFSVLCHCDCGDSPPVVDAFHANGAGGSCSGGCTPDACDAAGIRRAAMANRVALVRRGGFQGWRGLIFRRCGITPIRST